MNIDNMTYDQLASLIEQVYASGAVGSEKRRLWDELGLSAAGITFSGNYYANGDPIIQMHNREADLAEEGYKGRGSGWQLTRGADGSIVKNSYAYGPKRPDPMMIMVLAAPFAAYAMGAGAAGAGAAEGAAGWVSAEGGAGYLGSAAADLAEMAPLLGEPVATAVTGGTVGVPNAAGTGLTFDAAGNVVANELMLDTAGMGLTGPGGIGAASSVVEAGAGAAGYGAAEAAATGLAVDGADQLANEAGKLTAQNVAAPGSLVNTTLPTVSTGGNVVFDALGNPIVRGAVNSVLNAAGTAYATGKADDAARTQAAAAQQAAGILSPAAKEAARLQAEASTTSAKTLSDAATLASGMQATGYTGAAHNLAAALREGAGIQAGAATGAGDLIANASMAGGQRLSEAALKAAEQEVAGARRALDVNAQTLAKQEANQNPYMQLGTQALEQLSKELQPGGRFSRAFTMADAQNMPAYQFALEQGTQAINNAAATGGLQLSSANMESLGKFATGTAAQYQQQAFNQWLAQNNLTLGALQNAIATGQLSTSQVQQALAQAGVNAQTLEQNIGLFQATGTRDSAKALTAAEVAAANARAQAMREAAGFTAGGVTGGGRVLHDAAVKTADALAGGVRDSATATAAGQVGAAGHTATGIVNAANAEAGGVMGTANAISAGDVAKGNIVNSGISTAVNVLDKTGVLENVGKKVWSMADGINF